MSMSLLVFGILGAIMLISIIKASIPNKETRDKIESEKLKKERLQKIEIFKAFLNKKGIDFKSDLDAAILALASRENVFAAIIFYHSESKASLNEARKHVEKLCLSNGVSTELKVKYNHQSLLSATTAVM